MRKRPRQRRERRKKPRRSKEHALTIYLVGVKSHEVSLEKQEALVIAEPGLDYETVLRTIKKTGKTVKTGEADGESKSIDLPDAA